MSERLAEGTVDLVNSQALQRLVESEISILSHSEPVSLLPGR